MNNLQRIELIIRISIISNWGFIKTKRNFDKIINRYKKDIKIHYEIEKNLAKKNKQYTNIIKVLSKDNDLIHNVKQSKTIINEESRNFKKIINTNLFHKTDKLNNSKSSFYFTKSISSQKEVLFLQKKFKIITVNIIP